MKIVLNDLNKEWIRWISERNNILFSAMSNWKVVFDLVILIMNKYLEILLFGKDSNEIILSSNLKIRSYINRINKINISEFYAKNRIRMSPLVGGVRLLYELILKSIRLRVLENKIKKFSFQDSPLLQMLDALFQVPDNNLIDKQVTIELTLVDYELKFFKEYF
jgi:hypothetical protein